MRETESAILFDLDGTLIDSADGILASLNYAFDRCRCQPARAPSPDMIGPPLPVIVRSLLRTEDSGKLNDLLAAFEEHYDQYGLSNTRPYEGVGELLMKLSPEIQLIIVTNKRHKPTKTIIDNLSWADYFSATYTLDMLPKKGANKSDMIDACLIKFSLKKQRCLYIGDREEDAIAASTSGVPFIAALWGLNNKDRAIMENKYCSRETPVELMDMLLKVEADIVVG